MEKWEKLMLELASVDCKLVAVSKTKPIDAILDLYNKGQRKFGENRAQELVRKNEQLPGDIEWHMIGHLQSKKAKQILPFIHMIESVDNLKLLEVIDKRATQLGRKIKILLQFKIASEETKYGFELETFLTHFHPETYQYVEFCGVMGMASFTDDKEKVRSEFKRLKEIFDLIKSSRSN